MPWFAAEPPAIVVQARPSPVRFYLPRPVAVCPLRSVAVGHASRRAYSLIIHYEGILLMPTSKRGLQKLASEEGCLLSVYHCKPDPAETWTVGVGHVILPGDNLHPGDTITRDRAMQLLASDVQKCEDCIARTVTVPLTQNQYDALVSLIFNIGVGDATRGFTGSTVRTRLNAGLYNEAADHFLDWRRAGADPNFLLSRRQRERQLFLEPSIEVPEPIPDIRYADIELDFTPHSKE